jgi:hypothetical protein
VVVQESGPSATRTKGRRTGSSVLQKEMRVGGAADKAVILLGTQHQKYTFSGECTGRPGRGSRIGAFLLFEL